MQDSQGKYTVITGASSGIGYATAKAFAKRGENLIVVARRTKNLERLKKRNNRRKSCIKGDNQNC